MGPDPSRSAVEEAVDRTDAGGSGRMEQQSLRWRKSTKSNTHGACVEVAFEGDRVYVRDSKDRQGPVLRFTQKEWDAFLDGARKGEFDL
ncbi:DUF397 domain-containing protein [Thermocrispum sp.]|uniref:DUF397 domain-containing protein n=3 Tax=Thermocrispum agreste TaxID=37925 RepID=A0ABD6FGP2_9PSEU